MRTYASTTPENKLSYLQYSPSFHVVCVLAWLDNKLGAGAG